MGTEAISIVFGVGASVYAEPWGVAEVVETADGLGTDVLLLKDAYTGVDEERKGALSSLIRAYHQSIDRGNLSQAKDLQRQMAALIAATPQEAWLRTVGKMHWHRNQRFGSVREAMKDLRQVVGKNRKERYANYVGQRVQDLLSFIEQGTQDRGLAVSPLGLRDTTESLLKHLIETSPKGRLGTLLEGKKIYLVVQGKENLKRWRDRLSKLLGKGLAHQEQEVFEKNGVTIHLCSVHELSRLSSAKLRATMQKAGLVILDKEHHVRPIQDDPEDPDRRRFIRVLVEGGFLTGDFQIRRNSHAFLLGMTETVTEGAANIYGGKAGLIFSDTLPDLLRKGLIHKPETRVVLPKPLADDKPVHEAFAELGLPEKVAHLGATIDLIYKELRQSNPAPRIAVYAGSREEAIQLAELLEQSPRFSGKVALVISGDEVVERRRKKDWEEFRHGLKPVVIHVDLLVEGVDEFQTHPMNAVIFAGVGKSGSLRYALQATGAHLLSQKPPLFIDLAGMFLRHPQLATFDPSFYILEEGKIAQRFAPRRPRIFTPREGRRVINETDVLLVDLFGGAVGKNLSEYLRIVKNLPPRSVVALATGYSEELIDKLFEGAFVPHSRVAMEQLAEAFGLDERGRDKFLQAWALDRLAYYETDHPIPEDLPEGERIVLKVARYRMIRRLGGNLRGVEGTTATVLRRYLERGVYPTLPHLRRHFFQGIAKLVGKDILRRHLDMRMLGEYYQPSFLDQLKEIRGEDIDSLFMLVASEEGIQKPKEIVWEFYIRSGGHLGFPSPFLPGEEKKLPSYCKLKIKDLGGGQYEVIRAWGSRVRQAVDKMRESALFQEGKLKIRNDGFLGLRTLKVEDLREIESGDIQEWFKTVARKTGQRAQEIILQFRYANGYLMLPTPFLPGKVIKKEENGQLRIKDLGKGKYEIVRAWGYGAEQSVRKMRESALVQSGKLKIRNDGFIGLRSLNPGDLREIELKDVQGWFETVARERGRKPKNIIWQFRYKYDGSMNAPTPLLPGREKKEYVYGKLKIEDLGNGKYKIVRASGSGARLAVAQMRQSALFQSGALQISNDGFLGLRALREEELREITLEDIEEWFATVERETGQRPTEIIWQFSIEHGDRLISPAPLLPGREKKGGYGKLRIKDLGEGKYELVRAWGFIRNTVQFLSQSSIAQGSDPALRVNAQ